MIAATGSCLKEAGGPDSIYVDPKDARAMATAIDEVTENEKLRQQMIANGVEYAKNFEQEPLTKQMMELYQSLLDK